MRVLNWIKTINKEKDVYKETEYQIEKVYKKYKEEKYLSTQEIIGFRKIQNYQDLKKLLKLDLDKIKIPEILTIVKNIQDLAKNVENHSIMVEQIIKYNKSVDIYSEIIQFNTWKKEYIKEAKDIIEASKRDQKFLIKEIENPILEKSKSFLWKILKFKPNFPKEAKEQIKNHEKIWQDFDDLDKKFNLLLNNKKTIIEKKIKLNYVEPEYLLESLVLISNLLKQKIFEPSCIKQLVIKPKINELGSLYTQLTTEIKSNKNLNMVYEQDFNILLNDINKSINNQFMDLNMNDFKSVIEQKTHIERCENVLTEFKNNSLNYIANNYQPIILGLSIFTLGKIATDYNTTTILALTGIACFCLKILGDKRYDSSDPKSLIDEAINIASDATKAFDKDKYKIKSQKIKNKNDIERE